MRKRDGVTIKGKRGDNICPEKFPLFFAVPGRMWIRKAPAFTCSLKCEFRTDKLINRGKGECRCFSVRKDVEIL